MRKRNKFIKIDDGYAIELYKPNTSEVINYAFISEEDYDLCKDIYWIITEYGYVRGYLNGRQIFLHKLITNTDNNILIDHKNLNKLDNRRNNLRVANHCLNSLNRLPQSNSTTGITGVSYDTRRNKYRAYIKKNGKQYFLGYHEEIGSAIESRNKAFYDIFKNEILDAGGINLVYFY